MKQKVALITGGSGQIGSYQAKFLINKKYKVFITSRNLKKINNLKKLKILHKVQIIKTNLRNKLKISNLLKKIQPDEIYFYSGISNIKETILNPKKTLIDNYYSCKNLVTAMAQVSPHSTFFNANSIQIFGNKNKKISLSMKQFEPKTPYAKAKLKSFLFLQKYRSKHNLRLFNGLFLNTESILRPKFYVLSKVCFFASKINKFTSKKLKLGNINIKRDWGWCEEYVKIVWKYIQGNPNDFIIGTGKTYSLKYMIKTAFDLCGYDWKKYIITEKTLIRKYEILKISANVNATLKKTGLIPKVHGAALIKKLINFYKNE